MQRVPTIVSCFILLFSAAFSTAVGQESKAGDPRWNERCTPVTLADLDRGAYVHLLRKGVKHVRFAAKVKRIFGAKVILDGAVDLNVEIHPQNIGIRDELLERVNLRVDNVEFFGYLTRRGFVVKNWRRKKSDLELLEERIAALEESRDADGLLQLIPEIEKKDLPEKEKLIRRVAETALTIRKETLPGQDPDAAYRLALLYLRYLKNENEALALVARSLEIDPLFEPALQLAGERGWVQYGGEWLLYDEFRQREGFERVDGVWRDASDRALLEAIRKYETGEIPAVAPVPRDQWRDATFVAPSMPKEIVLQITGYPIRVRRLRHGDRYYEQWTFQEEEGPRYFYFVGETKDSMVVFSSH